VLPIQLQSVIDRCLEKEPARRYRSAGEVRAALETAQSSTTGATRSVVLPAMPGRRWLLAAAGLAVVLVALAVLDVGGVRRLLVGGYGGEVSAVRMAVLPFANLSGNPEQEYLSDGFTQEMITQLGRLHPDGLSVIARTSVMRYKNGDTPVDQIGRELNVDYVLEGSTQREANRVRVTAELIHVGDQTQLWADSYERQFSSILVVQSEVAGSVAEALALELLPAERARLASVRPVDPEAHEAYLRGIHQVELVTPEGLDTARRYFELALEKDPDYAPAYAGLTRYWMSSRQMGIVAPGEGAREAKAVALKALALDDASAAAHSVLGSVKTWADWDWAGAEKEFLRALDLEPNYAAAHNSYAHFLAITGRPEEALGHGQRALDLDPFNAKFHGFHSVTLYFNRRYDDALTAVQAAFAIQPDQWVAGAARQYVLLCEGRRDERLADQRRLIAHDPERVAAFEQGLAEGGYEGVQRAIADLLVARREASGGFAPRSGWIALRYLDAGDHDRAIDWLERAYEDQDPNLPYITGPVWDPLRSDPRFKDLLRRMNLPTAAF
jgi:TolB-like protein/Tfp pilus assembly protein PilF